MEDVAGQRRTTVGERAGWVSRWARSGQTVREFAREQQLSAASLIRWRREVRGGVSSRKTTEPVPEFHTVSLPGRAEPDWAVELELASGTRVRIRARVPAGWVRELVEALR